MSFILLITGAISKILCQSLVSETLITGLVCIIVYIILNLIEIHSSNKNGKTEKIMWLLVLMSSNIIAGMIFIKYKKKDFLKF